MPGLTLQPGIQVLIRPGGSPATPNALALGLNAVVSFFERPMDSSPLIASFWIAQADVVYAVVSTSLLLAVVALVLRPGNR
jgi:hypothetical protein